MIPYLYLGLSFILVYALLFLDRIFGRASKTFLSKAQDLRNADYAFLTREIPWLKDQEVRILTRKNRFGELQKATYLPRDKEAPCVILVHGYASNAQAMAAFAKLYRERFGFSVLLPDLSAHGQSGGNTIGFGLREAPEIQAWIDLLNRDHIHTSTPILLHGLSMGATACLFAAEGDLSQQVVGVIVDSPFIKLRPIFTRQLKLLYKLPAFPLLDLVSVYMRLRLGYGLEAVDVLKNLDRLNLPLLLIHGLGDQFVPYQMSEELKTRRPEKTSLWLVEGAGHACAYGVDPLGYQEQIGTFLKSFGL